MVAFCAMICPKIAKIGLFNASDDFVKADKKRPKLKGAKLKLVARGRFHRDRGARLITVNGTKMAQDQSQWRR